MKIGWVCFLAATLSVEAFAQKVPVTLEDLGKYRGARPVSPEWSENEKQFAYVEGETLFTFDLATKAKREVVQIKRLTEMATKVPEPETTDWTNRRVSESPIQWFSSGDRMLVSEGGDLFVVSLPTSGGPEAKVEQLTRTPVQEYDPKLSPDNRFVTFRRGHDLFAMEIASKRLVQLTSGGSATLLNAELDWVYPEELDLGTAHWWSPDSRYIAYLQSDVHAEPIFPQVSLLNAEAKLEPERFPQPGNPNAEVRLGIVSVEGGETKWMNLGQTQDHLIARVTWLPNSKSVAAIRLNRVQNDLELVRADIQTGQSDVLIHETDPYWINVKDEPHFFRTRPEFLWESERDGFRHLYLYGLDGKLKRQVTKGNWLVDRLMAVDEAGGKVYFSSNLAKPVEMHLYEQEITGSRPRLLTPGAGVHFVSVSPQGQYFTDMFSNVATPPSQVIRGRDGSEVMTWMARDRTVMDRFALSPPEIVQVPGADGSPMYGRLIKPIPFDPGKKYPMIVEVYGGPDVQIIHDSWSGANLEQVYAANGFVVWQMDGHGSSGRGHQWESKIYHNMGEHELEDQRAGIDHVVRMGFVDPQRIGLTGWSYGGYMTLYSLVNAPDLFRAGVSGAPVTDWRNYDSIYTERYMGLPSLNASGYQRSSPQTHAANLKAKLLLLHNIEDDNVHFSNTLQMAAALERANRQFRMVVYPQKTHGVSGEYSRSLGATMLNFFEENLK